MNQQNDLRYWIDSLQTKEHYKSLKSEIQRNGYFNVIDKTGDVKVYTTELAVIFTADALPVKNTYTQVETKLDGWEYLQTYIQAYREGEQYFNVKFKVPNRVLRHIKIESYGTDLHELLYHVRHSELNPLYEGWIFVKKYHPTILTHKAIKEFGYYSGIVGDLEEWVKNYPDLIQAIQKNCLHNTHP